MFYSRRFGGSGPGLEEGSRLLRLHPVYGLVAVLAAVTGATACGTERSDVGPGETNSASSVGQVPGVSPASAEEDTLTVLYPSNERLFSPAHDDSPKMLMFLPLTDPAVGPGGYPAVDSTATSGCRRRTGALAERWEHSADFRTWTIQLREGLRWHDGEPVTARDIEFTVELWKHPEVGHYAAFGLDSAVAVDDRTVRFHLSRPGEWPLQGWEVFYPEHLLAEEDPADFYEWEFWTRPVGNGPYRYVRHVPETLTELEANPYHHAGEPAVDRMRIKFSAAGSGTGLVELRSGNVDLLPQLPLTEAGFLEGDERFHTHFAVSPAHAIWLLWNRREPPLEDARIRRALTRAIDRRTLHRLLGIPERVPLTDAPYTPCQFRRKALADPWAYDPEMSRQTLEEAGWRDVDGDGIREKEGNEFRFTLIAGEIYDRAAVFIQDQLKRVGVKGDIVLLEHSVLQDRLRSGDFDAGIARVAGLGHLTDHYLSEDSRLGSLPPVLIELAAKAREEPDPARRDSLYAELMPIFRSDLPATWLYPSVSALAARREVRGIELPGGGVRPRWRWPFGGVEFLRVEKTSEGSR